jgi:HEAT repeat protein
MNDRDTVEWNVLVPPPHNRPTTRVLRFTVGEIAIWALGQIGDSSTVEPLMRVLESDPLKARRALAAEALGSIGDTRALEAVRKEAAVEGEAGLAFGQAVIRLEAAGRSTDGLLADLRAHDPRVVSAAITVLTERGATEALDALVSLLEDSRKVVASPWEVTTIRALARAAIERVAERGEQ